MAAPSEPKVVAVLGATGSQGGGLAAAILADKEGGFTVRGVTRNPDSDKAKALAAAGAEMVKADLDDPASLEAAFAGAYAVYAVTNFWEHLKPEKEVEQARNVAQAASKAGVQHLIWSTLEDTRDKVPLDDDRLPTLMDKYKVPHSDAKGEANKIFIDQGPPTTLLYTSFYWENMINFGMNPKRGEDGKLTLSMPLQGKLPGIAAADIGKVAYGVFKQGPGVLGGKAVYACGQRMTLEEMAAGLTKALGEEVGFFAVPFDVFRGLGFPGADDIGNMFESHALYQEWFCGPRDPAKSAEVAGAPLQTFDEWLAVNVSKIPLE